MLGQTRARSISKAECQRSAILSYTPPWDLNQIPIEIDSFGPFTVAPFLTPHPLTRMQAELIPLLEIARRLLRGLSLSLPRWWLDG